MDSVSKEDYLRAIFLVLETSSEARSIDVASELGVSKPSVSTMLRKLHKEGLIEAAPYQKIKLTAKGRRLAQKLTTRHRVIEVFLKDVLGYKKDVHQEAHLLEHAFSDESIRRLKKYLHNPQYCPHGKRIPR